MIRRIFLMFALVLFPVLVLAQDAPAPTLDLDPIALLSAFVHAIQGGQWPVAAVLVLVGIVWAVRKFGVKAWPWLSTSEGGTALAFLTAVAATLAAAALVPGATITWGLVGSAVAAAFTSIGAWTGARRLLRMFLPLVKKVPWLYGAIAWLSGATVGDQVEAGAAARVVPVPADISMEEAARRLAAPPSGG
jgi:hypothetical protein